MSADMTDSSSRSTMGERVRDSMSGDPGTVTSPGGCGERPCVHGGDAGCVEVLFDVPAADGKTGPQYIGVNDLEIT